MKRYGFKFTLLIAAQTLFIASAGQAPAGSAGASPVGKPAKDFQVRTLDGKVIRLSDFRGKVVMLEFMASWCPICVEVLPEVKKLRGRFDPSDFEIISISLDGGETTDSTRRDLDRLLSEHKVDWPVSFDDTGWDNTIAREFNVTALPVHVILDRHGLIRLVTRGGGKKEVAELGPAIDRLIRSGR